MSTILITGANRSLGYETARRLIEAGHDVWVGARDEARGRAAAEALGARFVQLDVTSDDSVAAAVQTVGSLDVLINNAGIPGEFVALSEVTVEHLRPVFEVNAFGPVRVLQAFRPLLEQSSNPVVVNVSSGMGSIGVTSDPDRVESGMHNLSYSPSKTALNMLTTQWAKAYPGMRINAVDPGYTATDINNHSGPQTVEEGTDAIVELAQIGPDGPTGEFRDRHGLVPW
ncbi:SDR family NAD(P)-dependent oxidoreductase [Solirubrobacter phytolaccae]|uniref:SDR family NAD(P)-dependent oxidoreductase n=1 Tax=Solirubrobacter phytolaccae TaxID=1404360 RepID=A0A9X3S7B1_9ACTN|nr:SDR family NAD(P)-dependent oxidoreductase [Solirubrobacter phytolaccae]MDA0178941.1 SDR family NAD(P)-dependent oxidoreductase [Solirubrobacter phytolaccae]